MMCCSHAAGRTTLLLSLAIAVVLLLAAGCGGPSQLGPSWEAQPTQRDGLRVTAFTDDESFLLSTAGGQRTFIPGVNMGATVPGTLPGELRVGADAFRRWFRQIGELGLRAVRVYTIMPPHFYEELVAYNRSHVDAPLYLVQGVWIPEESFLTEQDLYATAVRDGFRRELEDASAAVHGSFSRAHRRGSAWGEWTADASPWLLAYSIGVEWDPIATAASDDKNQGRTPYEGRYFVASDDASPTESWLAEMLDVIASAEARRGASVPLTFTNWPTTDPLAHPEEPLEREDLVGIDADHIDATDRWPAGFFASYHVYPYYPDFQRHEPGLLERGEGDPYAGYLAALRDHHEGLPVMITEFGVPSSTGLAHDGPLGRDQGGHSEQEAMRIDADLLRIIHDQGCAGGFVFEWMDEWFKFTWNTIDYELPEGRRQLWRNPWTNEEHFGLVAAEPGEQPIVLIDGLDHEWPANGSQVILESRGPVREVRAVKDEAYLYLMLVLDDPDSWRQEPLTLAFDVLPGESGGLPDRPKGRYPQADYVVVLGPGRQGQALVRASNDQYTILYGAGRGYVEYDEDALDEGSGVWHPQRLITNRPLTIPSTGEELAAETALVGELAFGTTDPDDPAYDSRAAWAADEVVEVRLPWQMIGFADPSSLRALRVGRNGALATVQVDRLGIAVASGDRLERTRGYAWDPWQRVVWHERPKAGLEAFAAAVRAVQRE